MIVTRVSVLYMCEKCRGQHNISFTPNVQNITEITQLMDKYKQCNMCAGRMGIVKATFSTLKDICGDDRFGSWRCQYHTVYKYYPILLRKATRSTLISDYVGTASLRRYINVVKQGYPWRCPICDKDLKYIDERTAYI